MKINLVVLAAGYSTRFLSNKLLTTLQGKPMIQHTFDQIDSTLFSKAIVVTQYEEIKALADIYGFTSMHNPNPKLGISSSLRLGLQQSLDSDGCMFLVGDQPYLKQDSIAKVCQRFDGQHITCAANQGQLRHPVIFPKRFYPELLTLSGDQGGRQLIHKYPNACIFVEIPWNETQDIDTPQQLG